MESVHAQLQRVVVVAGAVVACAGLGACGVASLGLSSLGLRPISDGERRIASKLALGFVLLSALLGYGLYVEADWIEVTHTETRSAKLARGTRLRFVHLTDLHVLDRSRALLELPARVNALAPDVVVFTGDSLNAEAGLPLLRELLASFTPRLGTYAVRGNHDVWYYDHLDLFGGGVAAELSGSPVAVESGTVALCGDRYDAEDSVAACVARTPEDALRVVLFHTPDLVETLSPLGVDLYFAGHTHGGQVRIPFFGAIATMSKFDKKYEMGAYQVGQTLLYVSRGVGFEPAPAPRIRLFCRPEIAVVDVVGEGPAERDTPAKREHARAGGAGLPSTL
jgi:predicted MPP superfamily phosphohydrolase